MPTGPTTIPDTRAREQLLRQMRAIRRAGTAAACLAGLSQFTLVVLAGLVAAISLDWLVRLAAPLRLALLLGLVAVAALALYRRVLCPLRQPSLTQVARQIQASLDGPRATPAAGSPDCLASGVEFALAELPGPLAAQTVARAAEQIQGLSLTGLVRWRWMGAWLAWAFLAVLGLAVVWQTAGEWMIRGLDRLAWPVVRVDWPRRTRIVSDWAGKTVLVAAGEPVRLEARIVRGGAVTAHLVLQEAGRVRRLAMDEAQGGVRSAVVRPRDSARFWFEAGDDDTCDRPGQVRVVMRPAVEEVEIRVRPPEYTGLPAGRIRPGGGPVTVPRGSRVDLSILVSKPLAAEAGRPQASVTLSPLDGAGTLEPLEVRFAGDRRRIAAGWICTRHGLVQAEFTDSDGFVNRPSASWRIIAGEDQLPSVLVQSPPDAVEVVAGAVLPLRAVAADDYGIEGVQLAFGPPDSAMTGHSRARQPEGPGDRATGSSSQAAGSLERLLPMPVGQPRRADDAVSVSIDHPWDLADLDLQPGDRIIWSIQAQDNFELDGRRHPPVHSPPRTVRIITETALLESVVAQLAEQRGKILQMYQRQQGLSEALRGRAAASADSGALQHRIAEQAQVAAEARQAAAALEAIARRLGDNRVQREALADSAAATGRRLEQVQSEQMSDVQRRLQAAQTRAAGASAGQSAPLGPVEDASPPADGNPLAAAAVSSEEAAEALQDLLQRTADWAGVESAALGLRDLLDRQKALEARTAGLSSETLGQTIDQLPARQRETLRGMARDQRSLADRLARQLNDMKNQSQAAGMLPPEQKARLAAAVESLEKQEAVADLSASAEEIDRNLTAVAQDRQQSARQAMEQALADLAGHEGSPRPSPKVPGPSDALARRLQDLARQQADLRTATGAIHARRDSQGSLDRAGLLRLNQAGRDQADLARQVDQAQEALEGEAARRLLATVAGRMQETAGRMQGGDSDKSVLDAQQQAAETLSALADAVERAARMPQGSREDPQDNAGWAAARTASELEALYLLQRDLLQQTRYAQEAGAAPAAIRQLGRQQQQVRDLAERVLAESGE